MTYETETGCGIARTIICAVEREAQGRGGFSPLKNADPEVLSAFARLLLTELKGWVQVDEINRKSDPEPVSEFVRWFNTLPEDTRSQIEDTKLLIVMQAAYNQGARDLRADQTEGLDLIERNLIETLNVLETLRK